MVLMNVDSRSRQASIGFLLFQYYHSIARITNGQQTAVRILDVWEYISRRLRGTSVGEVERAIDELEEVGIMRNGSLFSTESIDPHNKSKKKHN